MQYRRERVQQLRDKASAQFRELRNSHDIITEELRRLINKAEQQQADDPTAALNASMQHEQQWRRIERRLEAVTPRERAQVVDTLIAEAVEREDASTLKVLRAELPSYLKAEWPGLVPTVARKVDAALLPLAKGIERDVIEARAELSDPAIQATMEFTAKQLSGTTRPADRLAYAYATSEAEPAPTEPAPRYAPTTTRQRRVYGGGRID